MSAGNLTVDPKCPHCKSVIHLMQGSPDLQKAYRVTPISFRNAPTGTRVPSLQLRSGETLYGTDVYDYLHKWRKDADPPKTRHQDKFEMFDGGSACSMKNITILAAILIILYFLYKRYYAGLMM